MRWPRVLLVAGGCIAYLALAMTSGQISINGGLGPQGSTYWRRQPVARSLATFAPALVVWLLVQYWARGGPGGLADPMRFSRVRADAAFWGESLFATAGLDVPRTMAFLLPFWVVLIGMWGRDYKRSCMVPLVLATALTSRI